MIFINILNSATCLSYINKIFAEISAGELIDKITILEIKQEKIKDASKLQSIKTELTSLQQTLNEHITLDDEIKKLSEELKQKNLLNLLEMFTYLTINEQKLNYKLTTISVLILKKLSLTINFYLSLEFYFLIAVEV